MLGTQEEPLDSNEPMPIAHAIMRARFRTPRHANGLWNYRGTFWQWIGTQWTRRNTHHVEDTCWKWMATAWYRDRVTQDGEVIVKPLAPRRSSVGDVVRALEVLARFDDEKQAPCWLMPGQQPRADMLIPFQDVLVDVDETARRWKCLASPGVAAAKTPHTFEVHERTELWFDTVTLPCKWDPEAKCPRWKRCLDEWSQGDEVWQVLLQRWFGYCLMGHQRYAKWLLMYGAPRAGKGTISDILKALLGTAGYMGTNLDELAGDFGLDGLEMARVIDIREANRLDGQAGARAARVIKNVVGYDPVSINAKHVRQVRNFVIAAVPMMQSNEIPRLPDEGGGLSVKMLVLPFERKWTDNPQVDLFEQLTGRRRDGSHALEYEGELAGIAAWAVKGAVQLECEEVESKRFPVSSQGRQAMLDYHMENNPFDPFLGARFMQVEAKDGFVSGDVVWDQWCDWRERHGVKLWVPRNQLLRKLCQTSSWSIRQVRKRTPAGNRRGLSGVRMQREPTDAAMDNGA